MSVESVVEELNPVVEENMRFSSYTFVDVKNNEQRSFDHMVLSESQIISGGLAVFATETEKPRYYSVTDVNDAARRIEMVPAKNAYGKILLLFALLGIAWFVLDYAMKFIV